MMVGLKRKGASTDEVRAQASQFGRFVSSSYFTKYAGHASSASLVEYCSVMVDTLADLKQRGSEGCYVLLFGQGTESDTSLDDIPPEQYERLVTSMTHVLESALRYPAPATDPTAGNRLLMTMMKRLASTHDAQFMQTVTELADPRHSLSGKDKLCEASLETLREVLKMPEPDRTLLMRHLFALGG